MKLTLQKLACFLLSAFIILQIQAQKFHLVKDINNATDANPNGSYFVKNGSFITAYTVLNNVAYFSATDGVHGNELWRSDGTVSGTYMVKDINAGGNSSAPYDIVTLKSKIYFIANDGVHGIELWKSDGTVNGTTLLKDFNPGIADGYPYFLISNGQNLFFSVSHGGSVKQFWKSDGTDSGTVMLRDFTDIASYVIYPTQVGKDICFFVAANTGLQLWKTNKLQDSVLEVADVGLSSVYNIICDGKILYFTTDYNNTRLWRSNGTADSTYIIENYYNPSDLLIFNKSLIFTSNQTLYKTNGSPYSSRSFFSDTSAFSNKVILGNNIYFYLSANGGKHELWKTNTTTGGNILIKKFDSGYFPGTTLTVLGNKIYFSNYKQGFGFELWTSDGTTNGTIKVKDIFPGNSSSNPNYFTLLKNKVLFTADDGQHGAELWSADTLTNQVTFLKDINTNYTSGSVPSNLTVFNNNLYFSATTGMYGSELWKTDGTEQKTSLIKDINIGSLDGVFKGFSLPDYVSGGNLYFFGRTEQYGGELWKTNGDSTSTFMIKDLNPGPKSSYINNYPGTTKLYADVNGEFYFVDGITQAMYSTNGAPNNMNYVASYSPTNLTPFNNKLAFIDNGLLITDSTAATVKQLTTAHPDFRNSLFTYKNILYYGSSDGYMWRTDGTDANNYRFRKIRPDPYYYENSNDFNIVHIIEYVNANAVLKGKLYFAAFDSTNGSELWKSDGSSTGTTLIKDINIGKSDSRLGSFTVVDSTMYFFADDGIHGRELWKTDGTTNGTILVKDITTGKRSSEVFSLTQVEHKIIFLLYDSASKSFALWKSDGTSTGTKAVTDTAFTNMQILPPLRIIGNKIFFTATTPQYGSELWVGTLDGSFTPQLISFNGELSNNTDAKLAWSTLNEENISRFNLQRSIDGINYSTITNAVAGDNQSLQKNYQYTDNNITQLNANNIYYRLAIFNQDGDSSVSKIVSFDTRNKPSLMVQPNPVLNNFKLQVNNVHAAQKINIQVFNISGIKIADRTETLATGSNNFNYSTALWKAGTYITRITFANGSKQEIKISKQ